GLTIAKLAALIVAMNFTAGLARRLLRLVELHTLRLLHITVHGTAPIDAPPAADSSPESQDRPPLDEEKRYQEETVRRWFHLLERYGLAVVYLGGLWGAGYLLAWHAVEPGVVFLLQLL